MRNEKIIGILCNEDCLPNLRPPSIVIQALEFIGIREVTPADLCSSNLTVQRAQLNELYEMYPDLAGDKSAIGPGDDGYCQSWRGHKHWWKDILRPKD